MKEKKIPKFHRAKSILCNLVPIFDKYDMIYLNYNDIQKIPGDYEIGDMIELLYFFKLKKSIIFINYFNDEQNISENNSNKIEESKKSETISNDKNNNNNQSSESNKKMEELNVYFT